MDGTRKKYKNNDKIFHYVKQIAAMTSHSLLSSRIAQNRLNDRSFVFVEHKKTNETKLIHFGTEAEKEFYERFIFKKMCFFNYIFQ